MCGPTVNQAAQIAGRVAADATTMGTYEGFRQLKTPAAKLPEKAASAVATLAGAPPQIPTPDLPGPSASGPGSGGGSGPEPTPTPASPTETAAMLAKKRMQALRMGLLSTIATGGQGVTSAPNLFQPAAYAVGMKTALGQ